MVFLGLTPIASIWLWVKDRYLKWNHGVNPVVLWWLNCDPYRGPRARTALRARDCRGRPGRSPRPGSARSRCSCYTWRAQAWRGGGVNKEFEGKPTGKIKIETEEKNKQALHRDLGVPQHGWTLLRNDSTRNMDPAI